MNSDLIKNDVPASGQLKENDSVSFCIEDNANLKILFLGNSITRHGIAKNIGWYGDYGMAASSKDNDYVHKLVNLFNKDGKRVSYCISNLSEWENTRNMSLLSKRYAAAREFNADIVIVRLGENAQLAQNLKEFKLCYKGMVDFFASSGAQIVLTDLFWEYKPFDCFVKELANKRHYAFAQLHDLGARDELKALGEFEHAGVAMHPNDKGMSEIANRIYSALNIK